MRRIRFAWLLAPAACSFALGAAPMAEEPRATGEPETAQEQIEYERLRAAVESHLESIARDRVDPLVGIERLVALGPGVVPFLEPELSAPGVPFYLIATLVLGRIPTPESEAVLRRAVAAADEEVTSIARQKKACAAVALALQGCAEAVDLLDAGKIRAGRFDYFERMSALEVSAQLTAPASIPRLEAQMERYAADPGASRDLGLVLAAMGRLADPSVLPKIVPFLGHASPLVREEAMRALRRIADPGTTGDVFRALTDEKKIVRLEAAQAIVNLRPADRVPEILDRLDVEQDVFVRALLYDAIADLRGQAAIDTLRRHWGRPDPIDRASLVQAVASIGSTKGLNLARVALRDPDVTVALAGAKALGDIGGAGARETLLAAVADPRPAVAQTVVATLVKLRERRAGPRIAKRLLEDYLSRPLTNGSEFGYVFALGDAVVDLRYTEDIDALRERIAAQPDGAISGWLRGIVQRLERLRDLGNDGERWTALAASEDPALRKLAYARLGEIGGAEAAKALAAVLDRVDTEEAPDVLLALGKSGAPGEAAPPVERILTDAAYDDAKHQKSRAAAAWAARRLGGSGMAAALRASAERRAGADAPVLVYLAVLEGKQAVPSIRACRNARLGRFDMMRGREQDRLDRIVRNLLAGRSIAGFDVPPDELVLVE